MTLVADEGPGGTPARATYRLQLSSELGFEQAANLVPYLAQLGVSHLYCSPVLQARHGSTHGYDVAEPARLSAALGGEGGFRALLDATRAVGLRLVVDIVPNHLGVGADNPLWDALLAEGPAGPAGRVFDVDWEPALPRTAGKVIVPVLGAPYADVLHAGELTLEAGDSGPRVRYHEHSFPLSEAARQAVERGSIEALAGRPGEPVTWLRLHGLLDTQHYRLVHWRIGDAVVNYRRFFGISDLAAVRVEDPAVFARTHERILALVRRDGVDGLRIDHIDGLADPAGYLERLRAEVGADAWLVVEKILAPGEALPAWPVAGTTGYDFLADVLALFVDPAAEGTLDQLAFANDAWPTNLAAWARQAKVEVLEQDLAADCERLVDRLWALAQEHVTARDVTRAACREAIVAVLGALDVYRIYTRPGQSPAAEDVRRLGTALSTARGVAPAVPGFLWEFLEQALLGRLDDHPLAEEVPRRFHQVASAAMAKGVEDTLLYRQHRLAALNEVGVEPDHFGTTVAAFHAANAERADRHPEGMLTTSTHDTKRGEDVRLRIAALTELPDAWGATIGRWLRTHRGLVTDTPSGPAPDRATSYLCYQTLVGVWGPGQPDLDDVRERVVAYLVKAAREDGRRTSWTDPDDAYEQALTGFVERLLGPEAPAGFLDELARFARQASEIAMVSSLSQVLLRTTSPGVPDTYQGLELWGDNLVDPDNRRPVDFAHRAQLLAALDRDTPDPADLLAGRADGRIKLFVLSRALRTRRELPGCYGPSGGYVPLPVEGRYADRVVAFARTGRDGEAALTVAPRLVGAVMGEQWQPPLAEAWADTRVRLPDELSGTAWRDTLGGPGAHASPTLALREVLATLPLALFVRRAEDS